MMKKTQLLNFILSGCFFSVHAEVTGYGPITLAPSDIRIGTPSGEEASYYKMNYEFFTLNSFIMYPNSELLFSDGGLSTEYFESPESKVSFINSDVYIVFFNRVKDSAQINFKDSNVRIERIQLYDVESRIQRFSFTGGQTDIGFVEYNHSFAKGYPGIVFNSNSNIGNINYKPPLACADCTGQTFTNIASVTWFGGINVNTPSDIKIAIGDIQYSESSDLKEQVPLNNFLVFNVVNNEINTVLWDYGYKNNMTDKLSLNIKNGTTILNPEINDPASLNGNQYSGYTIIQGGSLKAGGSGAFSPNSDVYMTKDTILDLNGINQTINSYIGDGTIAFNQKGDTAGTILTVNGDFTSTGGTLVFNTVLDDDKSETDFLHIKGNANTKTNVKVNNLGGRGGQTVEGIKLITVDGAIAEDTEFLQNGRIVAGAYDYRLVQGGNGGEHNSWYLTSGVQPPVAPGPEPVDPITPVDPELPEVPEPPVMPDLNSVRPEGGSYLSNLAATEMFFTRLEDRNGVHTYTDVITGEKKQTSMWLRAEGHHIDSKDSSGQLDTRENRYTLQLGGDVAKGAFSGTDSWRLGLMAGYGNSHSNTRSDLTGYQSKGDADGYTVGMYGTWYADAERRTGTWLDTWLQYAWFNNSVQGEGLEKEKYDSKGLQASVETGYTLRFAKNKNTDYLLEPQAQVIWNGVMMDDHREANGTKVSGKGENNIHTRLGVRGGVELGDGTGATWTPYVAVNWHHNTQEYGVQMDDVSLSASGAKNIAEVKAGVEGQLTRELSVRGGISARAGSDDYRSLGGMLGVSYSF